MLNFTSKYKGITNLLVDHKLIYSNIIAERFNNDSLYATNVLTSLLLDIENEIKNVKSDSYGFGDGYKDRLKQAKKYLESLVFVK